MTRPNGSNWQPDLFNGRGIERREGTDRTDELKQARQEMRDTGSSDLFDLNGCTCSDFTRRGMPCKHILACRIHCALVQAMGRN